MDKKCSRCKQEFEITQKNQWYCKPCMAEKKREEYHRNRDKYIDRAYQWRLKKRQYKYDYLKEHPCEICGETRIAALDFDHIDQDTKTKAIANTDNMSLNQMIEEIKKCRVLCANCHRVHTAEQLGWYKGLE